MVGAGADEKRQRKKLIRHERKKMTNRLSLALRMGAETLENSRKATWGRGSLLQGAAGSGKGSKGDGAILQPA